jgi:hypothetical protein
VDDKQIEFGNEKNKSVPDSKLSGSSAQAASAELTAKIVVQLIGKQWWCFLSPDRKPQNSSLSWTTLLAAVCRSQQAAKPAAGLIGKSNGACHSPEDTKTTPCLRLPS